MSTIDTMTAQTTLDTNVSMSTVTEILSSVNNSTIEREVSCLMQIHSSQAQVCQNRLLFFVIVCLFFVVRVLPLLAFYYFFLFSIVYKH